ncbi:MAG: hypothetical protein KDB22_28625 [Planctomycetales bacterium]|nr:hypothetical protein [Planctomycetales bacterium]
MLALLKRESGHSGHRDTEKRTQHWDTEKRTQHLVESGHSGHSTWWWGWLIANRGGFRELLLAGGK